jgi:hypothetical protein
MHLDYDSATNTLRLSLDQQGHQAVAGTLRLDGTIDVSTQGRLVGVEFRLPDARDIGRALQPWLDDPVAGEFTNVAPDGSAYIQMTIGDDHLLALAIPRRGEGYEISYPSGNQ